MTAPPDTSEDKLSSERRFLDSVRGWHTSDLGRLAVLRRNAGEPLSQQRGASWLYAYLPESPRSQEARFLVATLFAFDRPALESKRQAVTGNLGASMHRLWLDTKAATDAEATKPDSSVARRFGILLDADYDPDDSQTGGELPFRLRQTVRLILAHAKSAGECWIHWPQLIRDIQNWNHPDKYVQKNWARAFYAPHLQTAELPTEEKE